VRPAVVREGAEVPPEVTRLGITERLLRISDSSPFPIFSRRKGKLKACSVVGTVTCGDVRIEIRPKTSGGDSHDRDFLLNLLRFSGYLKTYRATYGRVRESDVDPIEVLIGEIASEMIAGLREGIPRRYAVQDAEVSTVRGRINFTRLSTRLPSDQTLLPVRYAPLTIDNQLSRLIKWVARALLHLSSSAMVREKLSGALTLLRRVDLKGFGPLEVQGLRLSRFEARWERTLSIARLLLLGRSLDPTAAGAREGTAFIFPLERLFETSLRRLLPLAPVGEGVEVAHRTEELYMLKSDERSESAVRIRPDFLYRRSGKVVAVADAKWKLISRKAKAHGVDPADVYQMNAYLTRYQVRDALLLFPHADWMTDGWSSTYDIPGTDRRVHFVGIKIESLVSRDQQVRLGALNDLGKTICGLIPRCQEALTTS
jgi:5-methylcytosine-specific restriction enzyme subunit McrC